MVKLICIFCKKKIQTSTLDHLKKYHRAKISPFPKIESQARKFFRSMA